MAIFSTVEGLPYWQQIPQRGPEFGLAKELSVSAAHECAAPAKGTPHLIAKIISRVGPVGLDASSAEERYGDLAMRRSDTPSIEGLQDKT